MAGGQNFAYLEEDPSAPEVIKANVLYQSLYGVIGATWEAYVTTAEGDLDGNITRPVIHEEPTMLDMAKDIALGTQCPYDFEDVQFSNDQKQAISDALAIEFAYGQDTKDLWELCALVAPDAQSVDDLLGALSAYEAEANTDETVVPSDKVGMFLGLNVASGKEDTTPGGYEDVAKETAFKVANSNEEAGEGAQTIDAAANFTQVVKGTPGNYKMVYDEGMKDYRKVIISREDGNYQPFETVAFWFRGVATNNDSVAEDVKVPALEFTWTFSKETAPFEDPKLVSFNGTPISMIPDFEPKFTEVSCDTDGNIVLVFNREISAVDYVMSNPETETWNAFSGSNYVKDGNKLTVKGEQYLNALRNSASGRSRCVIVSFKDSEKYCSFTFTATPINP